MAASVCNHAAKLTWRHVLHLRCIVQFHLNDGKPVAMSIPATEHSVMTAWRTEREALENMIDRFGTGVFACVMDSYDYVEVSHISLAAILFSIYVSGNLLTSSSSTVQHQSAFWIHCSLSHIATHQPRSACNSPVCSFFCHVCVIFWPLVCHFFGHLCFSSNALPGSSLHSITGLLRHAGSCRTPASSCSEAGGQGRLPGAQA